MPSSDKGLYRGLVLREVDYRDSDRMLTILTAERGKISAKARGARRKNSQLSAGTQLLVYSEFAIFEERGRMTVDGAEPLELFIGLRKDILRLSLASYMAEALDAAAPENQPAGALLSDALNLLYALSRGLKPEPLIKAAFELRCAAICGFMPNLDGCAECGDADPGEPVLELASGELRCREHAHMTCAALDAPSLAAARYLMSADSKKMLAFDLTGGSLERLGIAAENYFLTTMERGFSTLDFYKGL